jgi:Uma2 family endonuclease
MIHRVTSISYDQYEQMIADGVFAPDERVELIRGELHHMSPAGPFHDDILIYLQDWSAEHARGAGYLCPSQIGVSFRAFASMPEPDIVWLKRRRFRRERAEVADVGLIIEVSHSSLRYDRETKAVLYAEAGIGEYCIANCEDQCLEVHRQPVDGGYRERFVVAIGGKVSPLVAPQATLDVADLFAEE